MIAANAARVATRSPHHATDVGSLLGPRTTPMTRSVVAVTGLASICAIVSDVWPGATRSTLRDVEKLYEQTRGKAN